MWINIYMYWVCEIVWIHKLWTRGPSSFKYHRIEHFNLEENHSTDSEFPLSLRHLRRLGSCRILESTCTWCCVIDKSFVFPSDMHHVSPGPPSLLTVPKGGHDDDVVVQTHPRQQDDEADQLEDLEVLPCQEERDQPDEQGPHTI